MTGPSKRICAMDADSAPGSARCRLSLRQKGRSSARCKKTLAPSATSNFARTTAGPAAFAPRSPWSGQIASSTDVPTPEFISAKSRRSKKIPAHPNTSRGSICARTVRKTSRKPTASIRMNPFPFQHRYCIAPVLRFRPPAGSAAHFGYPNQAGGTLHY